MGGFTVDEAAVAGLGGLVHGSGEDLGQVVDKTGMAAGFDGGLFGLLEPAQWPYREMCRIAMTDTGTAAVLGEQSGDAISEEALYYLAKDRNAAAAFDATLNGAPPPQRLEGKPRDKEKQFTKANPDPIGTAKASYQRDAAMVRPGSPAFDEQWGLKVIDQINQIADKASFSAVVRDLLTQLAGRDVLLDLAGMLGPDGWEILDAQAVAFQQAGVAVLAVRENIDNGRLDIQGLWTGNAANAALGWVHQYSTCLLRHATFLMTAGYEIMNFCYAMYLNLQELDGLIDLLIDQVAGLIPMIEAADATVAVLDLLKDGDILRFLGAMVSTIEGVSDKIWIAQELVMTACSAANRLMVDVPVGADWPAAPHAMPEGMR